MLSISWPRDGFVTTEKCSPVNIGANEKRQPGVPRLSFVASCPRLTKLILIQWSWLVSAVLYKQLDIGLHGIFQVVLGIDYLYLGQEFLRLQAHDLHG